MSEKPEALRLADDLRARIAYRPSRDSTQTLLTCDDAARCLEEQHAKIERLREAKASTVALCEQINAENNLLRGENQQLREALEIVLAADDDPKDSLTYLRSNTREVIKAALRREDV